MKWNSIRTKVLGAMLVCLIAGVGGTVALLRYSFAQNSQSLAAESVAGAQRLFNILEARESSKMAAVGDAIAANPAILDAFAARDRERLLSLTAPLYIQFKEQGITNWMFHTADPSMSVFLRLHNPPKFGDQLNRFMDREVIRTQSVVSGNELAKAGFAARVMRPVANPAGQVLGYMEFGEEIGRFIHEMKTQTGDNYGLLLNKKFVDRKFWADTSASLKRADNWDIHPNFVVADTTTPGERIIQFSGDLASVSGQGKVLERFEEGNSVFVRGIFPIFDTAHNTVGAMFVVKDISAVYLSMRNTLQLVVLLSIGALSFGAVLVVLLLNRLVFRRLSRIVVIATRVVGGDFESEIHPGSDDEIGQFEQLFEQFRRVFVDLLSNIHQPQENDADLVR